MNLGRAVGTARPAFRRAALARRQFRRMLPRVRIVIVEDHQMFREVLRKVCVQELRHEVVGEAGDGRRAVELVLRTDPDLVLLDLHLPSLDGFGVVEALRQVKPRIPILVLSSHCDDYTVFRAEHARVQGFVDKNTSAVAALKQAITTIGEGRAYFSTEFKRRKEARHRDPFSFDKLLTERERAVLALLGKPLSDHETAGQLGLSKATVEKHRFNILSKLRLSSTAELVRYAVEHGFTLSASPGGDGATLP
jgi:DNA-binding NarL/FixJ family response regulator